MPSTLQSEQLNFILFRQMLNPFFSNQTLESGVKQMVELIKDCAKDIYSNEEALVTPLVKPGFVRQQLPEEPPEEPHSIEHLIQMTRKVIFPGVSRWQSPKFFGYYPCSINVTNILGDMFAVITQSPGFNYAVNPSYAQLENIVVDWSAKAMGLPEKFLLKNSGGGIINNSASQSIFSTVLVAKFAKMKELGIKGDNPDVLKLVGYYGQGSHISSHRALALKDIFYRRAIPYKYNLDKLNYELDVDAFQKMVEEDVEKGLIPFWCGFSYGNTFSAAIDASERAFAICKKHKIWIQLDAAFLGATWICQKYRPSKELLQEIDSIDINFTKLLLNGTGGSLFYVADKKLLTESFGACTLQFPFYKNAYTGQNDIVDYKDWIVGLGRRNNSLKLYYTFTHYGFKTLRAAVESQDEKCQYLLSLIKGRSDLFKVHTFQYAVVTFHVLAKDGTASNKISSLVAAKTQNIKEGFASTGHFKDVDVVRIVVCNFHTTMDHIKVYFDAVVAAAEEVRNSS